MLASFYVSLTYRLESFWKREPHLREMSVPDWTVGKPRVHFPD